MKKKKEIPEEIKNKAVLLPFSVIKKKKSKVCLQWFSDIENLGLNQEKLCFGVKARKGKTDNLKEDILTAWRATENV